MPAGLFKPKGRKGIVIVTPILPGPFSDRALRNNIRNALNRAETRILRLFNRTTDSWQTRVDFDVVKSTASGIAFISVTTGSSLYYLIDKGARPHFISPVDAPSPVFRETYEAKTFPNVLGSFDGFRGGRYRRSDGLLHPGFDPRNFEKEVEKEIRPWFEQEVEDAFQDFVKKEQSHGMNR